MADNIRATPRNELLGLLADAMYGGLEYMKDPRRTQQMQGLAGLLESTGIPKTTERMAYGEPLTNIGAANVPLLKPETAEAMMTVAPFLPKGMKMTEGMPVGMSIKPVRGTQQAALDLAQQRAALPVEQGGLGLLAENTPEMRAAAMGFDTPAYRGYQFGTGRNKNTFYTDNPEIASQYAVKSGGAQYEINAGGDRYLFDTLEEAKRAQKSSVGGKIKKLKNSPTVEANLLRMENPLVVDAKEQNWNFIENPFAPAKNLQTLEKQLASVTSDKVVNGRPYTIDQQKQDIVRANYFNVYTDTNRLAEEARKKGYSDTVIQNVYDTALPIEADKSNYLSNVYVSSNPQNVRSRFAAFDPFRKDVATATAMGVALPDLLAAEPKPKEKRRQSAGLLSP
jgi:hypothetical protein